MRRSSPPAATRGWLWISRTRDPAGGPRPGRRSDPSRNLEERVVQQDVEVGHCEGVCVAEKTGRGLRTHPRERGLDTSRVRLRVGAPRLTCLTERGEHGPGPVARPALVPAERGRKVERALRDVHQPHAHPSAGAQPFGRPIVEHSAPGGCRLVVENVLHLEPREQLAEAWDPRTPKCRPTDSERRVHDHEVLGLVVAFLECRSAAPSPGEPQRPLIGHVVVHAAVGEHEERGAPRRPIVGWRARVVAVNRVRGVDEGVR